MNMPAKVMTDYIKALIVELMDDCPATAYQFDEVAAAISTLPVREIYDMPHKPDIIVRILNDRITVTRQNKNR